MQGSKPEVPAPQGRGSTAPRIAALDGLRAVAILIVLVGHSAATGGAPAALEVFRELGVTGVFLFFVISGFIITWLMLGERRRTGALSLSGFWMRRAWRILPPFAAASAGIALASWCGLMPWSWPSFLGALTFTKNTHLLPGDWYFGHFWSLSVEEQYYLVWPLLFMTVAASRRGPAALLAVAAASPVLALLCATVLPALVNLLPCIPYFAAGGLLALLLHRRDPRLQVFRLKPWQLAALCAAALVAAWCKGQHYLPLLWEPLNGMLLLAACLALVTESVLDDGLLRTPLSAAPLRALGLISYSVYLWQQLFLGPPDVYPHPWWWSRWPQNLCAALACGGAAYLLVERPSVWLRQRMRAHPAPRRAQAPQPLELLDS